MTKATAYQVLFRTRINPPSTMPMMGPKVGIRLVTPTITEIRTVYGMPKITMKIKFTTPTMTPSRISQEMKRTRILSLRVQKRINPL